MSADIDKALRDINHNLKQIYWLLLALFGLLAFVYLT